MQGRWKGLFLVELVQMVGDALHSGAFGAVIRIFHENLYRRESPPSGNCVLRSGGGTLLCRFERSLSGPEIF